jgi:hypothetical protein
VCLEAESNHRHGDFQAAYESGQDRGNTEKAESQDGALQQSCSSRTRGRGSSASASTRSDGAFAPSSSRYRRRGPAIPRQTAEHVLRPRFPRGRPCRHFVPPRSARAARGSRPRGRRPGLARRPDVLLVAAVGRDDPPPRRLALHLGAVMDLPTVVVTDDPLVSSGSEPGRGWASEAPLLLGGRRSRTAGGRARGAGARPRRSPPKSCSAAVTWLAGRSRSGPRAGWRGAVFCEVAGLGRPTRTRPLPGASAETRLEGLRAAYPTERL